MIKITGTVNVRLLLSATPPFCRNATISFPQLPHFDISAKPLIKSAFNAMGLPGMRSYGKIIFLSSVRADCQSNRPSRMSHRDSSVLHHTAWTLTDCSSVENQVSALPQLESCRSLFTVPKISQRPIQWAPVIHMLAYRLPSSTSRVRPLVMYLLQADFQCSVPEQF